MAWFENGPVCDAEESFMEEAAPTGAGNYKKIGKNQQISVLEFGKLLASFILSFMLLIQTLFKLIFWQLNTLERKINNADDLDHLPNVFPILREIEYYQRLVGKKFFAQGTIQRLSDLKALTIQKSHAAVDRSEEDLDPDQSFKSSYSDILSATRNNEIETTQSTPATIYRWQYAANEKVQDFDQARERSPIFAPSFCVQTSIPKLIELLKCQEKQLYQNSEDVTVTIEEEFDFTPRVR